METFAQEFNYSITDNFVEIAFGFDAYECSIENRSASATLEISKDGYEVIGELSPGSSFGLGGPIESIWIARAYGTGDLTDQHVAHIEAWTKPGTPIPPEPEPEPEPEPPGPDPLLEMLRSEKLRTIDARTRDLIARGFAHAGKIFSLSERAQIYWTNMFVARSMLAYPLIVNTEDDLATHAVADAGEVGAMYAAAVGTVKAHLGSGTTLKIQVRAAVSVESLGAIVDTRGL